MELPPIRKSKKGEMNEPPPTKISITEGDVAEGDSVGVLAGVFVGVKVGIAAVGVSGDNVGFAEGVSVGVLAGVFVGVEVGIAAVGVSGDNVGFAEGVSVGVSVGVFVGIAVAGEVGDNVGFAEGVPVGGLDLISISPLSVSLNTPPVTVPYLISEQFVAH